MNTDDYPDFAEFWIGAQKFLIRRGNGFYQNQWDLWQYTNKGIYQLSEYTKSNPEWQIIFDAVEIYLKTKTDLSLTEFIEALDI